MDVAQWDDSFMVLPEAEPSVRTPSPLASGESRRSLDGGLGGIDIDGVILEDRLVKEEPRVSDVLGSDGRTRVGLFLLDDKEEICCGRIGTKNSKPFCIRLRRTGLSHCGVASHDKKAPEAKSGSTYVRCPGSGDKAYGIYCVETTLIDPERADYEARRETVLEWVTILKGLNMIAQERSVHFQEMKDPSEGRLLRKDLVRVSKRGVMPMTPRSKGLLGKDAKPAPTKRDPGFQTLVVDGEHDTWKNLGESGVDGENYSKDVGLALDETRVAIDTVKGNVDSLTNSVAVDLVNLAGGLGQLDLNLQSVDDKVVLVGAMVGPRPGNMFPEDVITLWDGLEDTRLLAQSAKDASDTATLAAEQAGRLAATGSSLNSLIQGVKKEVLTVKAAFNNFMLQAVKPAIGPASALVLKRLFPQGSPSIMDQVDSLRKQIAGIGNKGAGPTYQSDPDPYGLGVGAQPNPVSTAHLQEMEALKKRMQTLEDLCSAQATKLADLSPLIPPPDDRTELCTFTKQNLETLVRIDQVCKDLNHRVDGDSLEVSGHKFDGFQDAMAFARKHFQSQMGLVWDFVPVLHGTKDEFISQLQFLESTDKIAKAGYASQFEALILGACKTTVPHPLGKEGKASRKTPLLGLPNGEDFGWNLQNGIHKSTLDAMDLLVEEIRGDMDSATGISTEGRVLLKELLTGAVRHAKFILDCLGTLYGQFGEMSPANKTKNWEITCRIIKAIFVDVKRLKSVSGSHLVPSKMSEMTRVIQSGRLLWGSLRTYTYMQSLMDDTIQRSSAYRETVTDQMVETFLSVSNLKDATEKMQKVNNRLNALEQQATKKRKKKDETKDEDGQ